jgi:hypothetical protein
MIFLLQLVALNISPVWHFPFHRAGTGPNPSSLKLRDSGHMPVVTKLYAGSILAQSLAFLMHVLALSLRWDCKPESITPMITSSPYFAF